MSILDSDRFAPSPGVATRTVNGELVLVDLDSERYFSLNATGAVIWNALVSSHDAAAAVDRLVSEYGVHRDTATAEAKALMESLLEAGLLLRQDGR